METSLLLARVIGITLVLVSFGLLINKKSADLLFRIYSNPGPVLITGIFELILGSVMVMIHNIWTPDYRGIITFIGWMLLIRGIGRTLFPSKVVGALQKFRKMKGAFTPLLVFIFLVGAYLAFVGFTR